jgi:hypothetical protein
MKAKDDTKALDKKEYPLMLVIYNGMTRIYGTKTYY